MDQSESNDTVPLENNTYPINNQIMTKIEKMDRKRMSHDQSIASGSRTFLST